MTILEKPLLVVLGPLPICGLIYASPQILANITLYICNKWKKYHFTTRELFFGFVFFKWPYNGDGKFL